jgi:hypothetical protein
VWRTSSAVSNAGPAPAPGATSLRCTFFPSSSSPPSSTGSDTAVEGFQTRPSRQSILRRINERFHHVPTSSPAQSDMKPAANIPLTTTKP